MGEPLVSAVIITYNQEKYIEQTIECALAQEVDFDYEIVIGEDCSTDNTREICMHYQEKYPGKIRVIISECNVGLMENFYRTVVATKGKYFAVCGGDDYWHDPSKLKKQVSILEQRPEYGMIHSDENVFYDDTRTLLERMNLKSGIYYNNDTDNTLGLLFSGEYKIVASSALYRANIFREHFDLNELKKNNILIEDMPLFVHIAAHARIFYMPESLVTRRVVEGSMTRKGFESKIKLLESVYRCYLLLYKKYEYKISTLGFDVRSIHASLNGIMFRAAFQAGRKDLARKYYYNILSLAGKNYVGITDSLRYYATYLPFGIVAINTVVYIYRQARCLLTGHPVRGV
jgi:glycosyltransferase involved in cell wall biosynthesis